MRSLVAHDLAEAVVAPELLQRHAGGDEGMVVAADGAVVLAGRPDVVLRLQQHHGERQAHARQRLGERDDVRSDPHPLEGEEAAGTSSEEHTAELPPLMRISYAVFCLKKKTKYNIVTNAMYT